MKQPGTAWQAIGTPKPGDRVWRHTSFSPLTDKDKLELREERRYRQITLPEGMGDWHKPKLDDSGWKQGKAPIGVGEFKAHGHGVAWTCRPQFFYGNKSAWGDGEVLLARNEFRADDLDYDYFRISVLSAQGYEIYLNGHKIRGWPWFEHYPFYRKTILPARESGYLKKGTNTLAVMGFAGYEKNGKTGEYHPIGQMDVCIEGIRMKDLEPGK